MSVLADIVSSRRTAVERLPAALLPEAAGRPVPAGRSFAEALASPGLSLIAEIKRRSPSAGALSAEADAPSIARGYAAAGVDAISVLTEPDFFGGSLEDLKAVREAQPLPALRKDFIVDPRQLHESRAAGADAVLLMVSVLGSEVGDYLALADELGLDALVEVHTEIELGLALAAQPSIIGVNNRDLNTLRVDLGVAERLLPMIPAGILRVAESGVATPADAARMAAAGADAILVGSALMASGDPGAAARALRG
ncbi:MAG: indole-3-glycerol phosphate synthase TrpC [Bauldia litoralis]